MKILNLGIRRRLHKTADITVFFYSLLRTSRQTCRNSRVIHHVGGKLRRFWLVHARKGYVESQLAARRGECRRCGTCCNLLFTCPMLTKEGRCLAYGTCRPQACKVFPIEPRDIAEAKLAGGQCGYHFKQQDQR